MSHQVRAEGKDGSAALVWAGDRIAHDEDDAGKL